MDKSCIARAKMLYADLGYLILLAERGAEGNRSDTDHLSRIEEKQDRTLRLLATANQEIMDMSAETDQAMANLTAQVAAVQAGEQSAIALLNGIPALLAAAGVQPAAIDAVTASLKSGLDPLLAAVAAAGPQPAPAGPVSA